MIRIIFIWIAFVLTFPVEATAQQEQPVTGYELRLYQGTPAWKLAQAVSHQQTAQITRLLKSSPTLVRYQEPRYGQTLLQYAVMTQRYKSAKVLLESGADPNQERSYNGESAMVDAASIYETSVFVQLLLEHGGNPNAETHPNNAKDAPTTPLIEAARQRLESVKLLVEAGANINHVTTVGCRSAIEAAFDFDRLDILHYLIIEKKADFNIPFEITKKGDTLNIAAMLKMMAFPLNSEKYKAKMILVSYLEARGVKYRNTPPPKHYIGLYTKEYLDKY